MIAAGARELGRVAFRLAGAGVVGTVIGVVAKRASAPDVSDVMTAARTVGALPVWETARRLVGAVAVPREALPILALVALSIVLTLVAAALWRRAPQPEARPSTAAPGAASTVATLATLAALPRRLAQRRATPARAGLVPSLAATGVDRAEIARRTGLSRDAVALSLSLAARQV